MTFHLKILLDACFQVVGLGASCWEAKLEIIRLPVSQSGTCWGDGVGERDVFVSENWDGLGRLSFASFIYFTSDINHTNISLHFDVFVSSVINPLLCPDQSSNGLTLSWPGIFSRSEPIFYHRWLQISLSYLRPGHAKVHREVMWCFTNYYTTYF